MTTEKDKLRKENIVWTVSEDYSYIPVLGLFERTGDFDIDYYKMLLLGYVYKKIDMDQFLDFLAINIKDTKLKNEFLKTSEIFLEDCFSNKLHEDRPGSKDYRDRELKKLLAKFKGKDLGKLTVEEEIERIYYTRLTGGYALGREVAEQLVEYLHRRNTAKTTEEVIDALNGAFLKFFFQSEMPSNADGTRQDLKKEEKKIEQKEQPKKPRLNFKARKKKINEANSDEADELNVESAEFTKNFDDDIQIEDERLEGGPSKKSSIGNEKMKKRIEARYGAAMYPEYITEQMEREVCLGIHEGIKLYCTEGKFVEGNYDKYFSNEIARQREKSLEYYSDNELIFRRSIVELKEILRKKVLLEDEDENNMARSGELVASKIWRNRYLNDEKIFRRVNKDELGSLSVEILLDNSASQNGREEKVAAQAYVIAEALTSLNIPTRVSGFCNFFNFLVLTQYRDYKDSPLANKNIFNYKASGSNRDGLAIKLAAKQAQQREEENKVLIVLSDGRPNDKIDLGSKGFLKTEGNDYEGEVAIKDTASEVFNIKMNGNHVLGVFTGNDEDLEHEKRIYGKDFAYIRRLDRFSHIIGFYFEYIFR